MRILVVDDDEQILRMMERLLSQRGHAVETCHGPFGASALAVRQRPELILLDVMMPAIDGEALSALLERAPLDPHPQIVLWSADDETVYRLLREKRHHVLSKNGDLARVIDELERLARTAHK